MSTFSFFVITMGIREIWVPTLIVGLLALILGIILVVVARAFQIPVNELQVELQAILPQANCGACGFSGCEGYSTWLAEGGTDTGRCPVGGTEVSVELAAKLGVTAKTVQEMAAHVMCQGDTSHTTKRFEYRGSLGCNSAQGLFSGPGSCTYGCMGFGDCVESCPYQAIELVNGIAVVNESKCKACGLCITVCPKKIIFMIPKGNRYNVECRNKWPGSETRKHCTVGCIGCQRCFKICPSEAITMDGPLAVIDPEKCTHCGKCAEVCPTKAISGIIRENSTTARKRLKRSRNRDRNRETESHAEKLKKK